MSNEDEIQKSGIKRCLLLLGFLLCIGLYLFYMLLPSIKHHYVSIDHEDTLLLFMIYSVYGGMYLPYPLIKKLFPLEKFLTHVGNFILEELFSASGIAWMITSIIIALCSIEYHLYMVISNANWHIIVFIIAGITYIKYICPAIALMRIICKACNRVGIPD